MLAARGDLDGALSAAEDALRRAKQLDMPFVVARTLLAKGQLHRRRKEKRLAKEALGLAVARFDELGPPLWAERARAALSRVGLRAGGDELTETERRVAELAAAGLTNRQVAAAAFMSPKTVAANLARVYRKLGISSRAELGAHIARQPGRASRAKHRQTPDSSRRARPYVRVVRTERTRSAPRSLYLAEHYRPGAPAGALRDAAGRLRDTASATAREDKWLRLAGTTIVPGDEAMLCVLESSGEALVAEAFARAGVTCDRVSPAVSIDGERFEEVER